MLPLLEQEGTKCPVAVRKCALCVGRPVGRDGMTMVSSSLFYFFKDTHRRRLPPRQSLRTQSTAPQLDCLAKKGAPRHLDMTARQHLGQNSTISEAASSLGSSETGGAPTRTILGMQIAQWESRRVRERARWGGQEK